MNNKIAITGANGQVGNCFNSISHLYPEFDFYFLTKTECNIASRKSVVDSLKSIDPDYIINAAAYTAVDLAEKQIDKAMAINAYALRNISGEIGRAKCIHLSSDYVYKDFSNKPLNELMPTLPKSVYAKSKLLGEEILRSAGVPAMIIRTSWVYSEHGNNFVKSMLKHSINKKELSVVDDQIGSPTYAKDLASAILNIIRLDERGLVSPQQWNSLYNYSNNGKVSWYEFAIAIFEFSGIDVKITAIPSILYPTPAERPKWSVLDTFKMQSTFGVEIIDWKVSLEKCIGHLVN